MKTLSRPRMIVAVAIAGTAIAAAAGCSPQNGIASAPVALPTLHSPTAHGMHSPSPTPTPTTPSATRTTPTPTPTTPTPTTPTPTPTSPAPTTPAPTQTGACTTSAAKGGCGPFTYPQIEGTSQNPTVNQDVWNPISGWQQTLYAYSPGDWSVTADMPAGNTAVVSYPSSGSDYNERPLSSFSAMRSSFSENMNATSGTSAWAAYDVWLNNWNNEVMIQHDFANNGACPALATATFGGSGGVPVQNWDLCKYGSELIWKLTGGSEKSGSVDILSMLTWLGNHGYLPQGSTLTATGYGWEICSTGGVNETFHVSSFSITAS
jgi:hypothetical protein